MGTVSSSVADSTVNTSIDCKVKTNIDSTSSDSSDDEDEDDQLQLQCFFCSIYLPPRKTEEYRVHLTKHLRQFSAKSTCPQCSIGCGSPEKMVDHFMMIHGRVSKHVCRADPNCIVSVWKMKDLLKHEQTHA